MGLIYDYDKFWRLFMTSPTLKLILNNWVGDPLDKNPQEFPFDVEQFCREVDPMINALKETMDFLDDHIAALECRSRQRFLDEDDWGHLMFLRDVAFWALRPIDKKEENK